MTRVGSSRPRWLRGIAPPSLFPTLSARFCLAWQMLPCHSLRFKTRHASFEEQGYSSLCTLEHGSDGHLAVLHLHDHIGSGGYLGAVRSYYHGLAILGQAVQEFDDAPAGLGVQVPGRLVSQDYRRVVG